MQLILKSSFHQVPKYGRDEHMFRNYFATVLILLINIIRNILDKTQKSGSYTSYFIANTQSYHFLKIREMFKRKSCKLGSLLALRLAMTLLKLKLIIFLLNLIEFPILITKNTDMKSFLGTSMLLTSFEC